MRTIKDQSVLQLGGHGSVLVRQRREHVQMDELMNRYRAMGDTRRREQILRQLVQLVFSHAFAEESVLWPAVRRSVPGGEELTARVEEEHQEINGLVADMERLSPGDREREDKVLRAFDLIRQDIRDEEDLLLPRLQDAMDDARLRGLGTAWEAVRRTAPTHPHPVIPRRPPGNALLGVPLSLYDRARDAFGVNGPAPDRALIGVGAALAAVTAVVVLRKRL
ncbi:hemerythrin domain-containing protein [Streptomyces sp. NPDC002952]|uniref:hemerythrin domain-containing protein n=1 Tax=Streptomyces sp. NPDC002952 TaxID=3364673 RepID=UPI003687104E